MRVGLWTPSLWIPSLSTKERPRPGLDMQSVGDEVGGPKVRIGAPSAVPLLATVMGFQGITRGCKQRPPDWFVRVVLRARGPEGGGQ